MGETVGRWYLLMRQGSLIMVRALPGCPGEIIQEGPSLGPGMMSGRVAGVGTFMLPLLSAFMLTFS